MKRAVACLVVAVVLGLPTHSHAQGAVSGAVGTEFTATVDVVDKNVRVNGQIFVPQTARRLRLAIVVIHAGLGARVFDDPEWRRFTGPIGLALVLAQFSNINLADPPAAAADQVVRNAAVGGADGLLVLMRRLADASGRPELVDAPLLFWGHSAGASFGTTFAELHPQRTIGFVRYHTQRAGLSGDVNPLKEIPALLIAGGKDNQNRMNDTLDLWRSGRALGAPWTFVIEPEATHFDEIDIRKSNRLTLPWIAAVVRLRLPIDGSTLRRVTDRDAWLGNHSTIQATAYSTPVGPMSENSWLPDEPTSRGWEGVGRVEPSPVALSLFNPTERDARNPILGVWRGVVTMGRFQFGAEVLIERSDLGEPAGRIVYLDGTRPDCGSSIVLIGRTGTNGYVLAETIDVGRACPSAGRLDLRLLEDGRLHAEWRFRRPLQAGAAALGTATLERKIEQ